VVVSRLEGVIEPPPAAQHTAQTPGSVHRQVFKYVLIGPFGYAAQYTTLPPEWPSRSPLPRERIAISLLGLPSARLLTGISPHGPMPSEAATYHHPLPCILCYHLQCMALVAPYPSLQRSSGLSP
jgi:hypothetical protein